ncbi:MAG: thioredoxin domain-containing protein [bacterium]
MKKNQSALFYRIGVIIVLVLVVVIVIVLKSGSARNEVTEDSGKTEDSFTWHGLEKEIIENESLTIKPKPVDSLTENKVGEETETVESKSFINEDVLAVVNGEEITRRALNQQFGTLPQQYKEYFKDDKTGFLEELVVRQLLLKSARQENIQKQPEYKTAVAQNPGQEEQVVINLLLKNIVADVSITESELREFFDQYKDQLPVKDYDAVKEQLRPMALEEKQRLAIEEYIDNLKSTAKIIRNEKWIETQEALTADNPLNNALKRGQPVVADFGRGTCMPCKMMEPILKKLEKKYQGRASILILDVDEYHSLSRKYRVMVIPTQVFFDSNGKEVYRHQGFMSEADIIAKLKELGVE